MIQKRIVVIHPVYTEADRLARLAQKHGPVRTAADPEAALALFAEGDVAAAVVDAGFAASPSLKSAVRPPTGVLLVGPDEEGLLRAADEWPPAVDVQVCRASSGEPRDLCFLRALGRVVEHARLRSEAAGLRRSLALQETKVKDVLGEIAEIKGLLNTGFIREVEKRLDIEARYVGSQKERQRLEAILRKIYGADDVSSLLDIVPDIRDIVQAESVTVYMMEENEVVGRYLKPLVWDNAFLDEPARRGQRSEGLDLDPGVGELLAETRVELVQRGPDVGGGKLLGQQLQEEFHQAPSFPPVNFRAISLTRARIWEIILTRSVTLMAPRESRRLKLWEHFRHMS